MMLILLDIDGVMVPARSWKKSEFMDDGFPVFSSKAVKALQKILSETNADILLTTSHKTKYSIPQWINIFQSRGITANQIQRLASDSLQITRKDEILDWYETRPSSYGAFVIIDDDKMLSGLPEIIKNNLVLTSPSIGLTEESAEEAITILMKNSPQYHL